MFCGCCSDAPAPNTFAYEVFKRLPNSKKRPSMSIHTSGYNQNISIIHIMQHPLQIQLLSSITYLAKVSKEATQI